jgi:pyruvate ferredoxin oxidoreductase delta subunit
MSQIKANTGWKDLPEGGVIPEGATSLAFKTGDWRSRRPVWDGGKCVCCYACWVNCPDSSILIVDGRAAGIDYEHCKGCGICATACSPKVCAMTMVDE